jgi:hypothetical protein
MRLKRKKLKLNKLKKSTACKKQNQWVRLGIDCIEFKMFNPYLSLLEESTMNHKLMNVFVFFLCCCFLPCRGWAIEPSANVESKLTKAIITSLEPDYTSITVQIGDVKEKLTLDAIKAKELRAKVKIENNDRIGVILGSKHGDATIIKEIKSIEKRVDVQTRFSCILIAVMVVLGSFTLCASGRLGAYIKGADNRISNSKFQIALWFFILFTIYLATLFLRVSIYGFDFIGGIGITDNLLALTGLSAFTYGSSKAITTSQIQSSKNQLDPEAKTEKQTKLQEAISVKENKKGCPRFKQLFRDDYNNLDFGDTQMFFITVLAVVVFFSTSFHFLEWVEYASKITLPDVDTTLLSVFGVGQGAYLAKKAATPLGK